VHTSHASIVSKIAHVVHEQGPAPAGHHHWWHHLQTNFHRRPEPFQLGRREQLQIGAVALFDVGLRTAVASVVAATSVGRALRIGEVLQDVEDSGMYTKLLDAGRARELYPQPGSRAVFHERTPRIPYFRPTRGRCVDLVWRSEFRPFNARLHERYLAHTENLEARARYWRHDGPARPTIVVLHGFAAEAHAFNERFFQVRWLYEKLGLDVACFTLPFHGPRRARRSAYTGQFFVSEGMCWTAEAFRQTVLDFRTLLDYLERERGAPAVGVSGISLGGYTAALLASLEPRLAFAIPNVPVVSLPDAVLEWNPAGTLMRLGMLASNLSLMDVRHCMAVHSPLSFEPVIPQERLMIVGGVGDRFAPPKHARLLWEHWNRPTLHWFPGNHLIHLDQGAYLRYIAKFLTRIGFLPPRTQGSL
jgi:pimeloyl-ACP methyl ester carboxylesterase